MSVSKILVVTGTRTMERARDVGAWLVRLPEEPAWIIHGDATGVDGHVREFALQSGWRQLAVPYPSRFGPQGGPIRNGWMLDVAQVLCVGACVDGRTVIEVHAFPGKESRGTWNCVEQAQARGLNVTVHEAKR